MFRPRLSESEIRFLLEVLNREKALVEEKLKRIDVLKEQIHDIKKEALYKNPMVIIKKEYAKKKAELERLESQFFNLIRYVKIYEGLRIRFQDLLAGKKRGRLKHSSQTAQLYLTLIE